MFIFYCLLLSVPFSKESKLAVFNALFPSIFTLARSVLPVKPVRRQLLLGGDALCMAGEAALAGSASSGTCSTASTRTS